MTNYRNFTNASTKSQRLSDDVVSNKVNGTFLENSSKTSAFISKSRIVGPGDRVAAIIIKTEKISVEEINPTHNLVLPTLKMTSVSEKSDTSKSISVFRHYAIVSAQSLYIDPEFAPPELMTIVYEVASKDAASTEQQVNRKCQVEMLGENYGVVTHLNSAGLPFVAADNPKVEKPKKPEDVKNKKVEFNKNKVQSLKEAKDAAEDLPAGAKRTKAEELRIFQEYSGDRSNNPRNIDIITETIQGVKTTMSRKTMPKLKLFFKLMEEKIKELRKLGEGEIPMPKPSYGESFRISTKEANPRTTPGGKFRSGRHYSIHNVGNACDIRLPKQYHAWSTQREDYRMNYINLFVHCAQLAGFVRIGIAQAFVHVDTAEQMWDNILPPGWWVYPKANSRIPAKRGYIKKRWISPDWPVDKRRAAPLDLTGLDYTKLVYTKEGKNRKRT